MYDFVVNTKKLERALDELKKAGKEPTEEAVKEVYVRLAGLVREVPEVEDFEVEEKPKKGKK